MKMKTLSLAVLGLAFAGAANAACVPANLTAWSATQAVNGTVTVATGGLESPTASECRLDATLTANLGSAGAYVRDDTPANEGRYRAQFLIKLTGLAGITSSQPVKIFAASTATPANSVPEVVSFTVYGNLSGTTRILGVATADSSSPTGTNIQSTGIPLAAATGDVYRVEIDWVKGATGTGLLKVWVNNSTEASPNATLNTNSSAWGGVDSIILGLNAASPGYRAAHLNKIVSFDKFDSRRQTFIGG